MTAPKDRRRTAAVVLAALLVGTIAWRFLGSGPDPEPEGAASAIAPDSRVRPPVAPISPLPATPPEPGPPPVAIDPAEEEAVPEVEAPVLDGLPLRIEVRDGTTGSALLGAVLELRAGRGDANFPAGVTSVPLRTEGVGHVLPHSPFLGGQRDSYRISCRLPQGYAAEAADGPRLEGRVSAFAERLEAVVLVWPEAKVRLKVLHADGKPAVGAEVINARAAGREVEVHGPPTDRAGEAVLRGIPFLRGERVVLTAATDDRYAESDPVKLVDSSRELTIEVVLPAEDPPIVLEGGVGKMFGGRRGGHRNLVLGDTGALRVTVLRRDGRPAVGVPVRVGGSMEFTDDEGVARFTRLAAGHRDVRVSVPGFHAGPANVWIGADVESTLELRQAEGGTGEVVVLDASGAPAAGATLEVVAAEGVPYCLMEGNVQTLGIHTDSFGRRALPGLPPGICTVTATLGSRSAEGKVEAGGSVVIRLPEVE